MKKSNKRAVLILLVVLFMTPHLVKASQGGDSGKSTANIVIYPRTEQATEESQPKEDGTTMGEQQEKAPIKSASKKLPQTNELHTNTLIKLGLALVVIALLGFIIYKKQRRMK